MCVCLESQETRFRSFQGFSLLLKGPACLTYLLGFLCSLKPLQGGAILGTNEANLASKRAHAGCSKCGSEMRSRKFEEVGGGGGVISTFASQC